MCALYTGGRKGGRGGGGRRHGGGRGKESCGVDIGPLLLALPVISLSGPRPVRGGLPVGGFGEKLHPLGEELAVVHGENERLLGVGQPEGVLGIRFVGQRR